MDLNTNKIKLRDDRWTAGMFPTLNGVEQGEFVHPYPQAAIVGVACADADEGDLVSIIYQARAIILPCDFGATHYAGQAVSVDFDTMNVVEPSAAEADAVIGILLETAKTTDTECLVDLAGLVLPMCAVECAFEQES